MIKKEAEYWEIKIMFNVRKGSYEAESKKQLKQNILSGIGKNEMNCIEAEDIEVDIK